MLSRGADTLMFDFTNDTSFAVKEMRQRLKTATGSNEKYRWDSEQQSGRNDTTGGINF
jgi:hypothetical protein